MQLRTWALLLVICTATRSARADITSSVYDDVKAIIEDLITDEVSRQVIPQLVCHGSHEDYPSDCLGHPDQCTDPLADFVIRTKDGKFYLLSLLYHYPETLQRIYAHQFGSLRSAVVKESEDYAAFQIYEKLNQLLYSLDDTRRRHGTLQGAALVAATGTDTKRIGQNAAQRQSLDKHFSDEDYDACTDQVQTNFKKGLFTASRTSPLDLLCASPASTTPDEAAHSSLKCELAMAFRSTLQQDGGSARGHLLKAVATIVQIAMKASPTVAEIRRGVVRIARVIQEHAEQPVLDLDKLKTALTGLGAAPTTVDAITDAVESLISTWSSVSHTGDKFDLSALLDKLGESQNTFEQLCFISSISGTTLCKAVSRIHDELGRATIYWPLISAISKADLSQVAHQVISLLFTVKPGVDCDSPNRENQFTDDCKYAIYKRFADSIVTYFVDSTQNGAPTSATSEAFRGAAEDVLRDLAANGGMDRGPSVVHSLLIPDLELSAQWGKAADPMLSGFRYNAELRFVAIRPIIRYTKRYYLAIHVSLLDLLAPLSEMAGRETQNIVYKDSTDLLANLFSPKVELAYGMPYLSKHLVVGAGATLHMVAPKRVSEDQGVTTFEYARIGNDVSKYLDFGVFVKYLL